MKIRRLCDLDFAQSGANDASERMNVCIVSSGFLGPVKNNGIGTVTSALARQVAGDGHSVTVLYTNVGYGKPITGDKPWQQWVEQLAAEGVALHYLPHDGHYRAWREASWLVKDFVAQGNFDLIYFDDHYGSGYYSLLAKRAGMVPFRDQLHCIIAHGSMEWIFNVNDYYATRLSDIEWMGIERRSVELADVVISPSAYLLRQYESYGWRMPAHTFCQPLPMIRNPVTVENKPRMPINEIVFFGRLEVRKGLWLFCEALDRLSDRFPRTEVTFLGRPTEFGGVSSALQVVNRTSRWPFRVRLFSDFDQEQALSYLRKAGRLAVMPSLADNSPCAVYECIEAGIPFVSVLGSGIDELVDQSCWDDIMAQPNVVSLTERLAQILERGARFGRARFDPAQNLATWSSWHQFIAKKRESLLQVSTVAENSPANLSNTTPALIVMIDSGDCSLSLLIENLDSHIRRFGEHAAYLILSDRRGPVQDAILEIFHSGSNGGTLPLFISDSRGIEEARQVISGSNFVFFTDAETEITTSFFISALGQLQKRLRSIVSCAVAVRETSDGSSQIEELPAGDLPGLAALGEPMGASVWAVSAANLAEEISSLEYYDAQLDEFASSWLLGQSLMQRCRAKGIPICLLPIVGGVETSEHRPGRRNSALKEARDAAGALGISPLIYKGDAAWFAMSTSLSARVDASDPLPVDCSEFLPERHPFKSLGSLDREKPDISVLAAALGRAELSLQLAAANGPAPGCLRHLTDMAARAGRLRPVWDLAKLLAEREVCEFGLTTLPKFAATGKKLSVEIPIEGAAHLLHEIGRTYIDARRLRIRRSKIQAIADLGKDEPGRIFILDLPLCGHTSLFARMRSSSSSNPVLMQLTVIDQKQGGEMGTSSTRLLPGEANDLTVSLHGIYGRIGIILEFSGAEKEKMDVSVEALRIE